MFGNFFDKVFMDALLKMISRKIKKMGYNVIMACDNAHINYDDSNRNIDFTVTIKGSISKDEIIRIMNLM